MTAPVVAPRKPAGPLPAGAARMSKTWVDDKGLPHVTTYAVPVDGNDRKTPHVRYRCRGHIEVAVEGGPATKQQCDQERWVLLGEKPGFCPDHGCELTSTGGEGNGSGLPLAALWRQVEPSARPLYVLAVEAASGAALHAGDVPAGLPLALTPAAVWAAYRGTTRYLRRRAIRSGRIDPDQTTGRAVETIGRRARFAAYCTTAAGAWLTAAATVDPASLPGRVVWASLPVWWAMCSAPWWRRVEARRNRPEPTPAPEVAPAAVGLTDDQKAAAEAARLWVEGEVAANTRLDVATWQKIACGWQAVVVATKRGAFNNLGGDNMKGTTRKIAAAFGVPRSAITWLEEHDDDPNRALLLVQPDNPLKEPQVWGGPASIRITRSRIESDVGRFIDAAAMVETMFRFDEGMPSELVLGATGSGKSERLRLILVRDRWTHFTDPTTGRPRGLFLNFLHDPKRLNSFGEFRDAIHGYGMTRDDAHIMVDALFRECMRRYDMLRGIVWEDSKGRRRRGAVKWNPLVHGPLVRTIWDEFHELAGDQEFVKKKEKMARYQRASGMGDVLASHLGTIGDTGSQANRDMLASGRASLLRTTSGLNAGLATGGQLTADPRALPKVAGMCLVADGEGPTIMGRYAFIPDDVAAERMGIRSVYDWLFDDGNSPIGYPAEIPPETAEAFGPEFMEWMAAGRSERGRDGWVYKAAPAPVSAEEGSAADGLFQILLAADQPLSRAEIGDNPLWRWSITQTLTNAINAGLKADPAWLVRLQDGKKVTFELSAVARERAEATAAEEREEVDER